MNSSLVFAVVALSIMLLALVLTPKKVKGTDAASHMNLQFGAKP